MELVNCRRHYDLRKYSFTVRVTSIWNSLPGSVTSAEPTDTFKNQLDKFGNVNIMYEMYVIYSEIGIGNRSLTNESLTDCIQRYLMSTEASPAPIFCCALLCFADYV